MNEPKNLVPERIYSLDNEMSLDKIVQAKESKEPLVGKVFTCQNPRNGFFTVDLGNGFKGILPIANSTIYSKYRDNGCISPYVYTIIGKHVRVLVKDVLFNDNVSNPTIILSRQELMVNSFKFINNSIGKVVDCIPTATTKNGVFVTLGNGITGLIRFNDLCVSRISNISDIGLNIGDVIQAKIIYVNSEKFQVGLNYKDQFENVSPYLEKGTFIEVVALQPVNELRDGYFVHINPATSAIMDIPANSELKIPYGTKVIAIVKGVRQNDPSKLKLNFINFI